MGSHKMDRSRSEINTLENAQSVHALKYPEDLVKKIRKGKLKLAIYGLGHVGEPLAATWIRAGAYVIGLDKSEKVREYARAGKTQIPVPHVNPAFTTGLNH